MTPQSAVKPPHVAGTGWNVGLSIAQAVLAILFGIVGTIKTFSPIDQLARSVSWVADAPLLVRFIGLSELLGALGLVLPAATRIRPLLTPLAALGLLVIMLLAAAFHILRGELASVPVNVLLGGLAALVVWGRSRKAPIEPRK